MHRLWTKILASGLRSSAFSVARILIPSPFTENRLCELVDRGEQCESDRNMMRGGAHRSAETQRALGDVGALGGTCHAGRVGVSQEKEAGRVGRAWRRFHAEGTCTKPVRLEGF